MRTSPTPALAVRGLRKAYGGRVVVDDVTFAVPHGRIVALLGPNGAGKTTTMRMLLGLVRPDSGDARVDGVAYTQLDDPLHTIGAVLDAGGLHPSRTARQHLAVGAAMAGVGADRVESLLAEVGLREAADRRIGGYSLGMRQRLAVATALLGAPRILVLDEPANGLDPAGARWLREYLRAFASDGGAVLLSSHVLGEVAQIADDAVLITAGRVAAAGTLAELTATYGGDLEDFYLDLTTDREVR